MTRIFGRSRISSIVASCALLTACSADMPPPSRTATTTDSAGIRVVHYDGELPDTETPVELVWQHGHEPDDYMFQFVLLGALRADGGAVVGDMGNSEVVAIPPSGESYEVWARTGQGPGEVRQPRAIERWGDSFWVEDVGNAKLVLLEEGSLTRTISTQANAALTRGLMPRGVDAEGRLLMHTSSYRSDFEEEWLDGHLTSFDPDTGALDTVGSYPMAPRRAETSLNPYSPFGSVTVASGSFVQARTNRAELLWRDADGTVVQILRWDPTPEYPDEAAWAEFEAAMRADLRRVNPDMSEARLRQFLDEQIDRFDVDPSVPLPLFSRLHGGQDGEVWLSDFSPGNTWASAYTVLASDGEALGRVEFPGPFHVLDVDRGHVLGVFTNELDVQSLAVYRYHTPR